jgi:hypothetical protein
MTAYIIRSLVPWLAASLDHLVGAGKERRRDRNAERALAILSALLR